MGAHNGVVGRARGGGAPRRVAGQRGQVLDGRVEQGHRVGVARPDGDPPAIRERLAHIGPSLPLNPAMRTSSVLNGLAHKRTSGDQPGARSPSASTANTRSCTAGSVLPARPANMPFSSTMRSDVTILARTAPACWARG